MAILDKYPLVRNEVEPVLRNLGAEDGFIDAMGYILQLELEEWYTVDNPPPLKFFFKALEKLLDKQGWSTARNAQAVEGTIDYLDVPFLEPGFKPVRYLPTQMISCAAKFGVPAKNIKEAFLIDERDFLVFYRGDPSRTTRFERKPFATFYADVSSMSKEPGWHQKQVAFMHSAPILMGAPMKEWRKCVGEPPYRYVGELPEEPGVDALDKLTIFTMAPIKVGPELLISLAKDLLAAWRSETKTGYEVEVPGWRDFIKLGPGIIVSEDKRKVWRLWRSLAWKAGHKSLGFDLEKIAAAEAVVGPIPLTPEEFRVMRIPWERARRLAASPTPEAVRKVGAILTAIDNVQDAMITTTYLSRIGVKALSKILPKLALKLVPGLGYVALATDLLSIQNLLAAMFKVKGIRKVKSYDVLKIYPNAARKRALGLLKLKGYLPTFREAIQIAQTTEWLTGYGLSLGAGVAFLEDLFFGLVKGARFKIPLTDRWVAWPGLVPDVVKKAILNIADILGGSPEVSIATLEALRILNFAPIAMMYAEHLSDQDNLAVLTGAYQAAKYLERTQDLKNWHEWAKPYLDIPISPREISPAVRDALTEAGDTDIKDVYPWPFFDGVDEITPRMRVALMAPKIVSSMRKWFMRMEPGPAVQYAMTLYSDLGEVLFRAFEGPDEKIETSISPEWRAPYLIQEYGLWDEIKGNDELAINVSAQITDFLIRRQHKSPDFQEVKAVIDLFKRASTDQ